MREVNDILELLRIVENVLKNSLRMLGNMWERVRQLERDVLSDLINFV